MSAEPLSEVFCELVALAERRGVSNIGKMPGCWEVRIDDAWRASVNGSGEERRDSAHYAVPAFSAVFWRGDWPAGVVGPYGGTIVADQEDVLIAALKAAP